MIQSLGKQLEKQEIENLSERFGIVIIDECHHIPADTFRRTVAKLSTYYQYGLTATPFRKGSEGKQIFIHLGELIADIKPEQIQDFKKARIIIRETTLELPFNSKTDTFETLSKVLIHDSARNKLIFNDVSREVNKGRKVVLITERIEHIHSLNQISKQSFETVTLSGEDSESNRKAKWRTLRGGNYQVLITTGQFFGEGTDLQNASCVFLVYPFSFKGKLIQYIGRVQRSEITPIIYDYRDIKIDYLNKLFLKRNTYYRHFDRQSSLFEESEEVIEATKDIITVKETIKVPVDKLDFRYGAIVFKHLIKTSTPIELEFELENDDVRPEFDVLKPYFAKFLKSKMVEVNVFAEVLNGQTISQIADSKDLEIINREIIDSVKFRFTQKVLLGKKHLTSTDKNLVDLDGLQKQNGIDLYQSEDELLNAMLQNEHVKHYRQIRYLAMNHNSSTLKLRFVLNPFSFVFLLTGKEQYHIVLETLDTEEATYIWHLDKNKSTLPEKLKAIEVDLNTIRNDGRQKFIESQPENFSRLVHDYSDERKGFIIWKDLLEERFI